MKFNKERKKIHDTNILEDYRNWKCKNISCTVSSKFFDQVKYVANFNKMDMNEFTIKALEYYMSNEYPLVYDTAKSMVKIIEQSKEK